MRYFDSREMAITASSTSWRRARCRRPFRPCASMASSIGMAGFSRIRQPRRFSTTIRAELADLRRAYVESDGVGAGNHLGGASTGRKTSSIRAGLPVISRGSGKCISLRHVVSELVSTTRGRAQKSDGSGSGRVWLPDADARRATACASARRENHTKDIDFSPTGIRLRWEAGYTHTKSVLEQRPWDGEFDPLEGVILHEREEHLLMAAE